MELKLKEKLEEFANLELQAFYNNSEEFEPELRNKFKELAEYFIYGGYIKVRDDYRIYTKAIEFYFHSEENGLQDEIVYHRKNNYVDGDVPYFPGITFHAHPSGFDIAFENESKKYRASVLIRAYEVLDIRDENKTYWLAWEKRNDISRFYKIDTEEAPFNKQSTYLFDILNGFGDAGIIAWEDKKLPYFENHQDFIINKREGVYNPDKWDPVKYEIPRNRKWKFSRPEKLTKSDII